jgi:uncharacterized protein (DUF885 family)
MTTPNDFSKRLAALVQRVLDERWKSSPPEAASSGLHEYDGMLPPVTMASIEWHVIELRAALTEGETIGSEGLAPQELFDRDLLLLGLRNEIWELSEDCSFTRDPMALMWPLEATAYLDRSYAPVEERMASMTDLLLAVPAYLDSVRALLNPPFAKPVLHQALEAYSGLAQYYRGDVAEFAEANLTLASGLAVMQAAEDAAQAIDGMIAYLRGQESISTDDFALGIERYAKMLSLGEMVDVPLAQIEAAGERELLRHQALVRDAADRIAPGKPLGEAISVVTKDHPAADRLIDVTRDMLEEIRSFTIAHDIVSVVSEIRAEVRETPAFMRWAFAAMNGPGPFEKVATESFYYVTPVEAHWTPEQAEEWLSNFGYATLKMISVHEAYPGHYVHFLRHANAPSVVSKVFGAYSFWEGWAHYCEEMFLEAGYGDGDPKIQLAMAQEALVRVCRLLCSLRMHTKGQTLAEAERFFQDEAFMEELPAKMEAIRGTFDPGYLNYTLGKLLIYKLRVDWQLEQGDAYSLKAFHDELLGHGAPPIPMLRKHMLRNDDGVVLS